MGEGGEQHVVDLRAIGLGHLTEEGLGLLRRQRDHNGASGRLGVVAVLVIHGHAAREAAARREPVGALASQLVRARVLDEALGPALERGRLERERDGLASKPGCVGRPEVVDEDAPGDAVDGEVVHHEQQARGPAVAEIEEHDAQGRTSGDVEASLRRGGRPLDGRRELGVRGIAEINAGEWDGAAQLCQLLLDVGGAPGEAEAERVMVLEERRDRCLDRAWLERCADLQEGGLVMVIGIDGIELQPPALHGRERNCSGDWTLFGRRSAVAPAHSGEFGDGLVLEELPGCEVDARRLSERDDLNRQDRVAADGEEVVVDTDTLEAEHAAPDGGELPLDLGLRRHEVLAETGLISPLRRRQRAAIHLAARGQRQRAEEHEGPWYHRVRQPVLEEAPQLTHSRGGLPGDEVAHQSFLLASVLARQHHGLADGRVLRERRLDLAELDAVAADLDLEVAPAAVLERSGREPAGDVARAIDPRPGRGIEGILREPLGGQLGPVEVTAPNLYAADVEVARHADRLGPTALVEHVHPNIVDGPADGDRLRAGHAHPRRHIDRRLGGTVEIVELDAQAESEELVGELR